MSHPLDRYLTKGLGQKVGKFVIQFDTNSTSAPDGVKPVYGGDVAVARSGVGTFTITFAADARPVTVFDAHACILGSEASLSAKVVSYVASTGVLTVEVAEEEAITAAAWTEAVTVTSDTATLASAGYVVAVEATAGSVTGPCQIVNNGAPATTHVDVDYTAGVATLLFNAATDGVTECDVLVVPTSGTGVAAAADTNNKTVQVGCWALYDD